MYGHTPMAWPSGTNVHWSCSRTLSGEDNPGSELPNLPIMDNQLYLLSHSSGLTESMLLKSWGSDHIGFITLSTFSKHNSTEIICHVQQVVVTGVDSSSTDIRSSAVTKLCSLYHVSWNHQFNEVVQIKLREKPVHFSLPSCIILSWLLSSLCAI